MVPSPLPRYFTGEPGEVSAWSACPFHASCAVLLGKRVQVFRHCIMSSVCGLYKGDLSCNLLAGPPALARPCQDGGSGPRIWPPCASQGPGRQPGFILQVQMPSAPGPPPGPELLPPHQPPWGADGRPSTVRNSPLFALAGGEEITAHFLF